MIFEIAHKVNWKWKSTNQKKQGETRGEEHYNTHNWHQHTLQNRLIIVTSAEQVVAVVHMMPWWKWSNMIKLVGVCNMYKNKTVKNYMRFNREQWL